MNNLTITLCVASLAMAPAAFAQREKGDTQTKPMPAAGEQNVHLYKLSDLNDLDLKNGDKSIGEIDGCILDATTGRVAFALVGKGGVLGIGEKEHLIPWESITVTAKDPVKNEGAVARTRLTEADLEAAPVYKKNEAIDAPTVRRIRENAKLPSDSTWERIAGTHLVTSGDLKGSTVRSPEDKDLGKIEDIVLAPNEHMVAYVVLGAGGVLGLGEKHYALPLGIFDVTYDKDNKVVVHAPLTKERFEGAPEYNSKEWKSMSDAAWVRKVSSFWKKDPYWTHTTPASAGKQ
jgi:sporulation protein YlmC with PRC-barrel domain